MFDLTAKRPPWTFVKPRPPVPAPVQRVTSEAQEKRATHTDSAARPHALERIALVPASSHTIEIARDDPQARPHGKEGGELPAFAHGAPKGDPAASAATLQLYRQNIARDVTGAAVKPAKPGGVSTKVVVRATVDDGVGALSAPQEQLAWGAGTGAGLHNSNKVKNAPHGMQGYLHDYNGNVILAVTRLDTVAHTIQIDASGHVQNGWHIF
jgi:hypothetical protein